MPNTESSGSSSDSDDYSDSDSGSDSESNDERDFHTPVPYQVFTERATLIVRDASDAVQAYRSGDKDQPLHQHLKALTDLRRYTRNLRNHLPEVVYESTSENINGLIPWLEKLIQFRKEGNLKLSAAREYIGVRARPRCTVDPALLATYLRDGFTDRDMGKLMGVHERTIQRRLAEHGLKRYSDVSQAEVLEVVKELKETTEASYVGCGLMFGLLMSMNIRVPRRMVRQALSNADPVGTSVRWAMTVKRRTYWVARPNSLWHIDGWHGFRTWHFVIHGGIDGKTRLLTYLVLSEDNTKISGFKAFMKGVDGYGWPSRVRGDQGGENWDICKAMLTVRGVDRGSFLAGKSTANQRIERLWRDMWACCTRRIYEAFVQLTGRRPRPGKCG